MYLGQCMQMQSDNAQSTSPNLVPFRQCKLTELLFSNSFTRDHLSKRPQKAIMIVAADPLGDFNATSQILRYSALAREVTVPRIPSVTSTILASTSAAPSGRSTPVQEELEAALTSLALLREKLELTQVLLAEETERRQRAEDSWRVAESRTQDLEAEIREEVWSEMEARVAQEQRRWRAAREEELEARDEHLDRKLEILANGITVYEDETAEKENRSGAGVVEEKSGGTIDLEDENAMLREKVANLEREKESLRSPSKKMRVLKTRKWNGSGMGLDDML
nr:kinesin-like motor protein 9 [Quercus suber]